MIRLNNCIPGPVYPLSTERTVSQSCIGAGHEGWKAAREVVVVVVGGAGVVCVSLGIAKITPARFVADFFIHRVSPSFIRWYEK